MQIIIDADHGVNYARLGTETTVFKARQEPPVTVTVDASLIDDSTAALTVYMKTSPDATENASVSELSRTTGTNRFTGYLGLSTEVINALSTGATLYVECTWTLDGHVQRTDASKITIQAALVTGEEGGPATDQSLADRAAWLVEAIQASGATITSDPETGTITITVAAPSWDSITGKPSTFTPATHTQAISTITDLQTTLDAKAPLASPTFIGTPAAPTPTPGDNSTKIATTAFVTTAVSGGGSSVVTAEVEVSTHATGGTGTALNPWTGWDTAITWTAFTRYRFKSGYYSYDTSPNFLKYGIELIGEPGTYFVHTGTGNGFTMDAGATVGGLWIQNVRVENITVLGKVRNVTGTINHTNGSATITGNGTSFTTELAVGYAITTNAVSSTAQSYIITAIASDTSLTVDRVVAGGSATFASATYTKTQHGFYLRGVRNGVFDRLSCKDVAKAAIWTEACVTNSLRMFRCTFHEPAQYAEFQCRPQYGIVFSGRGADWSTTWNVEEPVIEGTQVYGIWLKSDTYGNSIINGTSEGNKGIGIQIDGPHNTIIGTDTEGNGGNDMVVNAARNVFINFFSTGTVTVTASGGSNQFLGGYFQNITIQTSAYLNRWLGATVNGTYTDSGNTTLYLPVSGTDMRSRVGINRRIGTAPASGTIAADCKLTERIKVGVSGTCTISAPTNPTDGDVLEYVFNNNSGSSQTLTWNAAFAGTTEHPLPTTIATGKAIYVHVEYSSFWSKWHCINVSTVP